MPTDRSPRSFADRIAAFCRNRLSSLLGPDTDRLEAYLLDLIALRECPPVHANGFSWREIATSTGIAYRAMIGVKEEIRPALDAIVREYNSEFGKEPAASMRTDAVSRGAIRVHPEPVGRSKAATPARPARVQTTAQHAISLAANRGHSKRGAKPREIDEFPQPSTSRWQDPPTFREALVLHMERHGDSYWHLHRAIVRDGETFDRQTLRSWLLGTRSPISVASMEMLGRIERRYRLPSGYFKAKLPHRARAVRGHEPKAIGRAERRRLAWHLPEKFNALPRADRERIVEWVRRVILSGATNYRRYQAAASKHRYTIRFPGVAYGRSEPAQGMDRGPVPDEGIPETDPDLVSGVIEAPPQLTMEMAGLVRFKTSTLTAFGLQRNGVWGEETTSQKIEHLGLMLGALAASPNGPVRGYGVPLRHLTLGLLVFPGVWDWYVQWRERKRGFYTAWEIDMLRIALALTRQETGWLRQHGHLVHRVQPISGLVSSEEIERARADWHGACDAFFKHATGRVKEIQRVARVHRDLACCRFRGHRDWVFHETGGGVCDEGNLGVSSRSRRSA